VFLFAVDDIESAMCLSVDEFKTKYGFEKPSPSGKPVMVYCRAGVRATQAAETFIQQFGFTRFVRLSVLSVLCNWTFLAYLVTLSFAKTEI